MHAIERLRTLGQSVWLDFIDRGMLTSGELAGMIEGHGLAGLTSNPTIFQKSLASSTAYDPFIRDLAPSESDVTVFEQLQVRDVTLACDLFRPLYERTNGADGFVSIEVSPKLARDTRCSIEQARRLWNAVARPNLFVKIPGTVEGLPAIEQCLAEGININITLLFSVDRYSQVALAYFRALEARIARNLPIDRIASVASFFVSRVDTKVDKIIDALQGDARALPLRGKIAIANAKVANERCQTLYAGEQFERLASKGARRQRVLWASTSTKDPSYPDTYYADALIGPHTVDTMTLETFRAYMDHGNPEERLTRDLPRAHHELAELETLGIRVATITDELENDGIRLFDESFDKAVASIAKKRATGLRSQPGEMPLNP
jgi:transaldolase